jgi:hypothetical protein
MRTILAIAATCPLLLGGCAGQDRLQDGAGAARPGAPVPAFDASVLAAPRDETGPRAVRLPDRITLPACYRLVLVDGHLTLVREADPQALQPVPASIRVVTGEIARGELAYQPGLLPQELAAEVAANRESAARMDLALDSVMRRSRELSAQALELQEQSRTLAEIVRAEQSRGRGAEAAGPDPKAGPRREEPAAPQD